VTFAHMQLLLRENAYLQRARLLLAPAGIQLTDFLFPAGISSEFLTRPVLSFCPISLICYPGHSVTYQLMLFARSALIRITTLYVCLRLYPLHQRCRY